MQHQMSNVQLSTFRLGVKGSGSLMLRGGEGTQDQVPQLDAVGRDDVAEAIMVVAQEFWEVM